MFDTPSPEMKKTSLKSPYVHTTPKGVVCRKIANSPAFLVETKSLTDFSELSMSPLQLLDSPVQPTIMTPTTSSGESPGSQAPSRMTPRNKAKRRLIEIDETSVAPKKLKPSSKKRSFGQINSGVSHKIRMPEKRARLSLNLTLSDIKKAKAESASKHPLDPLNKSEVILKGDEVCSNATIISEVTQEEEKTKPVLLQTIPAQQLQSPSASRSTKRAEEPVIPPKSYTPSWNQRYKKYTKERKFFKSRVDERTDDRVVTISVNDNLKLKIGERVEPRASAELDTKQTNVAATIEADKTNIDVIQQEWDDTADSMELSTNIQDILNGLSEDEPVDEEMKENANENSGNKLFPLFYKELVKIPPTEPVKKNVSLKSQWTRAKKEGEHQMMLDAGQKAYGAVQCPDCMLVYHIKEPEDELLHTKVHDSLKDTLKFTGWKKERLVRRFDSEGYVLAVHPGDASHCWKKVHSVLKNVVDHELGFSEIGIRNPEATKVYLYITEKKIVGVLVVESLSRGYRMVDADQVEGKCCSSDPTPALCGVSRIWTLASFRRHNIATRLLDAMRSEFLYGKVISVDEVAFSGPTENGLAFAQRYSKRRDFLVYNM